ncbi:MAG: four helix bundle protein [Clostridia bacterium]|nr:four helix bundle protein [Clostridia bacterium]MBQ8766780.1 four helix bundle protein [Clostridia bacterium]
MRCGFDSRRGCQKKTLVRKNKSFFSYIRLWRVISLITCVTTDFIAKLQISLKETAETEYWLRLLILSEYINEKEGESLLNDCLEIKMILISILNTAKENK